MFKIELLLNFLYDTPRMRKVFRPIKIHCI